MPRKPIPMAKQRSENPNVRRKKRKTLEEMVSRKNKEASSSSSSSDEEDENDDSGSNISIPKQRVIRTGKRYSSLPTWN